MTLDLYAEAQALKVVDVWQEGNETGWVTPRVLYDPALKMVPALQRVQFWADHGTVGTNTLRFWGEHGSINNGTWTLANYLIPKEQTQYADGSLHDTTHTIFKMVPDGYACNHLGACIGPIWNGNTIGVEYESLQNGTHDISEPQYLKGALVYAHDAHALNIPDWFRVTHGLVAIPWGRRSDPWAGKFRIGHSWALIEAIRQDPRISALWGFQAAN